MRASAGVKKKEGSKVGKERTRKMSLQSAELRLVPRDKKRKLRDAVRGTRDSRNSVTPDNFSEKIVSTSRER